MGQNKRNYGIDLLRIVSMLMVLILHILGAGGVLKNTVPLSANYEVAWFLEIAAYCAVNCYALVSGYVGLRSAFKYTGIIHLWLQVAFYSVSFTAVAAFLLPEVTGAHVFQSCMPVLNNVYWYFTSYFVVALFSPLLNRAVLALTKKQGFAVAITIFILFSIVPTLKSGDVFFVNRGYSALWLTLLYLLGAILHHCDVVSKVKARVAFLAYAACILVTWLYKYVAETHNVGGGDWPVFPVTYVFPLVVLAAVALVLCFARLRIGSFPQKLIAFFAPLSFGVYLVHSQRYFWRYFLSGRFTPLATAHPVVLVCATLLFAVLLFIVCALIDFLRDRLFRLLHVRELLTKIEAKLCGDLWRANHS